jgi:hypothetical protein
MAENETMEWKVYNTGVGGQANVSRCSVSGGWLYVVSSAKGMNTVFVPDTQANLKKVDVEGMIG